MARGVGSILALCAFALYLLSILPAPTDPVSIVTAVAIDRPPAAVFEFVTTPENWPKLHHSSLRMSGASNYGLQGGERTTEDFRVAGRYGRAQWTVTERDEPRLLRIEASGAEGGKAWITYTLSDTGHGTRFERDLRYRVPNLFTAVLDTLVLRSKIKLESETGLRELKQVLEGKFPRACSCRNARAILSGSTCAADARQVDGAFQTV